MPDFTTEYLGKTLRNPLVVSASPLCEDLNNLRRMEEAGASAIVLHSLFEEQLAVESQDLDHYLDLGGGYAESLTYFPDMTGYNRGPDGYLDHLERARATLSIPVYASLNGVTPGGWTGFARRMESAGADAIELNVHQIPTHPDESSADVEQRIGDLAARVCDQVRIPVAVKIGSQVTAPVHFARRLAEAGARGLVLFNRFYQPDFDLETLSIAPTLQLSHPAELLPRLHWTALIFGQVRIDLAITGGVHSGQAVLKAMMAGARVVMVASTLLKHGIDRLRTIHDEVAAWMTERAYASIRQMQGSMSLRCVPDPAAFERGNYLKVLRTYALGEHRR